ncbi:MAG: hypothetical protein Q9163_000543 [Psora crenata]
MTSTIVSYASWTFLPGLVTGWIQTVYYGITIRAGDPKPQPGTPRYQKHRRRIHITVIIAYLLYTIYEADYWLRQEGDFYRILGVPYGADEKKIKSRFRRLAALYHPDKLKTESPSELSAAESHFVSLKQAQDTLSDPIKRFAYERFGPDMLNWQHCSSIGDYLSRGLQVVQGPLYAVTITFMILLGFTSYMQAGRYWRYLFLAALLVLEMHTITRPYHTPILTRILNPVLEFVQHPPFLPFQLLALARKSTFTLFIAFSQFSGLWLQPATAASNGNSPQDLQQLLRLEQLAKGNEAEASRLLAMDMAPFVADEQGKMALRGRIREWLVNNTIRTDPEVRDAMGRALERRTAAAPPGAKK